MGSQIPLNSNFKNLSCPLGNLTLNGNVNNGTAASYNVVTINDPSVIRSVSPALQNGKFLQIVIGGETYYLQLYK